MALTPRDWRIELMEAHPNLFHPSQAHPERVNGYPACGDGWRDLLERACARIEGAVADGGGAFRAWQIKEKFGTLRFYWGGEVSPETRSRIDEAIALAEARSACTCETCGEPGRLYQIAGWYKTACSAHTDVEPVPVRAGREYVHVIYRFVDGKRVVRARRYVRETDSFVEVDPSSVPPEEG